MKHSHLYPRLNFLVINQVFQISHLITLIIFLSQRNTAHVYSLVSSVSAEERLSLSVCFNGNC